MPMPPDSPRSRVVRGARHASYDPQTLHAILDEAQVCHIGFVQAGQPFVIPANFARQGDTLYLHGASASRLMGVIQSGAALCVEVTLVDGLIFGRSAFQHGMNYRSVVAFGVGRLVVDPAEKLHALQLISEHFCPGRWAEVRPPNPQELALTAVVAIHIEEASAKLHTGTAGDAPQDLQRLVWGGEVPLRPVALAPRPDQHTPSDRPLSPSIERLVSALSRPTGAEKRKTERE